MDVKRQVAKVLQHEGGADALIQGGQAKVIARAGPGSSARGKHLIIASDNPQTSGRHGIVSGLQDDRRGRGFQTDVIDAFRDGRQGKVDRRGSRGEDRGRHFAEQHVRHSRQTHRQVGDAHEPADRGRQHARRQDGFRFKTKTIQGDRPSFHGAIVQQSQGVRVGLFG